MLTAAAHVVCELGYGGMSVARVTGRAGVSRRTFYELFDDREDCFLALFEDAVARTSVVARQAASGQVLWRERVRAGLSALLVFAGDEPGLGPLLVVEALGAGSKVLAGRSGVLDTLIAIVDEGRDEMATGRGSKNGPPPLTAEGVVGAVLAVIHARLLEPGRSRLIGLLNPLMGMIVLPYLGPEAVAQELAHATPRSSRKPRKPDEDPLQGLDMRLTNRTLRVLAAIAERPGGSNRQVAETAGVSDQGQISKLLTRLHRLGLIHNTDRGRAKGEPNAWTLTAKGGQIEGAARV
ncbi:MAG TPA: TetR family transcriptional regulator [Solirubrobacteraceae bacterium]|jgi:AcrR family transcriptional regulator